MSIETTPHSSPSVGLALGSGSARGWAHIGVIQALNAAGIRPQVVCGTSIGALVGAALVSGRLEALDSWVRTLSWWDVVRLMDVRLTGGGFIDGKRLMTAFADHVRDVPIEGLAARFAAVATDLDSGREVWLQTGSLLEAVRASIALPGLFAPARVNEQWLVDGGLVNPVPVSVCRALGAELVIAVNLNGDIVGKHFPARAPADPRAEERNLLEQLLARIDRRGMGLMPEKAVKGDGGPGMFEVLAGSINIMQDRITRSRMAGDPPDVLLAPRLAHLGLLEFDRAGEAIEAGRRAAEHALPAIAEALRRAGAG